MLYVYVCFNAHILLTHALCVRVLQRTYITDTCFMSTLCFNAHILLTHALCVRVLQRTYNDL